jgi:hypothetical protein
MEPVSKVVLLSDARTKARVHVEPPAANCSTKAFLALSDSLVSKLYSLDQLIEQMKMMFLKTPQGSDRESALADLNRAQHRLRNWHLRSKCASEPTATE